MCAARIEKVLHVTLQMNQLVHLPDLLLESKNIDRYAGKTSGYTGRDKNAEP